MLRAVRANVGVRMRGVETMGLRRMILWGGFASLVAGGAVRADDGASPSPGREIPGPFAPLEYLVGSWKGNGFPTANRVRGWPETHAWAWKFEKGTVVGMTVTMQGDKALAKAQIMYDPATKRYQLSGSDPAGKSLAFSGAIDKGGKTLTFDRVGATSDRAKQRLSLFPNSNFVRYTVWVAEQEPGAPQFKRVIEVGLTKEGESFAAGSSAADLPKCIITGGASTMTVSYQGKSYPLCCTGCRDEFNDNPEKYVKKAALRTEAGGKTAVKPASSATNKDDGAFEGLGDDAKPAPKTASGAMKSGSGSASPKGAAKAETGKPTTAASRAASLLRLAQNLEKARKIDAALTNYRQVVKTYPGTAAARTAAARIEALSQP